MAFGRKSKKGANEEVIRHWYTPLDNFSYSTKTFYDCIEYELKSRKVPELKISRIELKEKGAMSDRRQYLRLKRERFVFDICAAPFGTSYFFSFRFVELPQQGIVAKMILNFLLSGATFAGTFLILGPLAAVPAGLVFLLLLAWAFGGQKETYHREDTRLMYLSTVETVTQIVVDRVTAATGIRLIKRYERALRDDDFKPTQRQIEAPESDQASLQEPLAEPA